MLPPGIKTLEVKIKRRKQDGKPVRVPLVCIDTHTGLRTTRNGRFVRGKVVFRWKGEDYTISRPV